MIATTIAAPSLNYVLFFVADVEASAAFFADTLGFTLDPSQSGPDFRQFAADPGGATIGLFKASDQTPPPGEVALYLGTPNIAALREAWVERGLAASPIVQMPFGKIFEITTPDGRTLTPIE
jgi:predicted enzyme related to lactoylglutathione lyase